MRYRPFIVAAGICAVLGGTLRIVAMFGMGSSAAYLYYVIDVFLMLGLIGWYVSRAEKLGEAGMFGFAVATIAILMIRSIDLFGKQNYGLGAALLVIGLAIMNLPALLRRDGPQLAPALWLASLVCGIAAFAFLPLVYLAALLFGTAFVAAGVELLRARP